MFHNIYSCLNGLTVQFCIKEYAVYSRQTRYFHLTEFIAIAFFKQHLNNIVEAEEVSAG